jgi:DNA replication and repair protein RecF
MRAARLEARGFRNLAAVDLALPPEGAVFLGPNGHGKTNLLEALCYPVLFRSVRGTRDPEVVGHGEPGFHLRVTLGGDGRPERTVAAGFALEGRRKRVAVDGAEQLSATEALGTWLAVAFLPGDVGLVSGAARERRLFLDRVLSLADRAYLRAARGYRAALEQRNAALRRGRPDLTAPFDGALAAAGAEIVRQRLQWVAGLGPRWAAACGELGEPMPVRLEYRGRPELAEAAAWPTLLAESREHDRASGSTSVGPHRDDLALWLEAMPLRLLGSTGQQRTAAVALKLCELETLARRAAAEPALVLDDVFAELDRERQERLALAVGMGGERQVFVTAPRRDELPHRLELPVFTVRDGRVAAQPEGAVA